MFPATTTELLYSSYRIFFEHGNGPTTEALNIGMGFSIKDRLGNEWLVTNNHIFDEKPKPLQRMWINGKTSNQINYSHQLDFTAQSLTHSDLANDCLLLKVVYKTLDHAHPMGLHYSYAIEDLATEADFNNLLPGDSISIPSYSGPQFTKDAHEPVLRKGTIASDPRVDFIVGQPSGKCVAYDGYCLEGTSGSPVVSWHRGNSGISGKVLGVHFGNQPSYVQSTLPQGVAGQPHWIQLNSGVQLFCKATAILDILRRENLL